VAISASDLGRRPVCVHEILPGVSIFDRKLSDLTVGDVAKGYAAYWLVGGVASLVVLVIGISMMSSMKREAEKDMGPGFGAFGAEPGMLETSPSVHKVTNAEYRGLETGTHKKDVLAQFGEPGGTGSDIYSDSSPPSDDCLVYSRRGGEDRRAVFCFDARDRLTVKRRI
jgi:hypothetical protein